MSRRLRLEEEKLKQLKDAEEEVVVDKLQVQLERIYAPLVWRRTATGIRIQDLKENHFNDVLDIFKEHFIADEVLCKNAELKEDEVSVESLLTRMLTILKDDFSIIAFDETRDPECVVGALIMQVIHKADYGRVFSRVQLIQGEALKKCIALTSHLNRKGDVYAKFNCDKYLRYYGLCIVPEYRHKGLGYQMMSSGLEVARAANVPVVMGVFSDCKQQKLAKKLGMEVLYEVNYVDWRDADRELIFDDPGAGNYTCALMAGMVPPPPPPPPPPPKPKDAEQQAQKGPKSTRADKKAAAAKKSK